MMTILRFKFSIFAACACSFLSCTPRNSEPVGKSTLTVTVSANSGKTEPFVFQAKANWKTSSSCGWSGVFSTGPHTDSKDILVGQDFQVTDERTNSAVALAVLKYSSTSAEVKTELAAFPDVELIVNATGDIPLVIKDKDGALLKFPVKPPAGKAVYTISPTNP